MGIHGSIFSPSSHYLVFVSPFWLPVAIYLRCCFPLRFSPLLFDLGIFLFGIVGVVHSPASAYTPSVLLLTGWVAIFGVCDSPRIVSHGWLDDVLRLAEVELVGVWGGGV